MEYLSNWQINLYSQMSNLKYKIFLRRSSSQDHFKSSGLAFGSVLHSALSWTHRESMTNGGVPLKSSSKSSTPTGFSQRAETEIRYKDAEEEMRLAVMAKEMLTMYYEANPPRNRSELSFSVPLTAPGNRQDPLIDIEGVIDLIEADDVVAEFKTSSQMMDARDAEKVFFQLTIYSYAYEKLYQTTPKALKIIDFVKSKKPNFITLETKRDEWTTSGFTPSSARFSRKSTRRIFFPKPASGARTASTQSRCQQWLGH